MIVRHCSLGECKRRVREREEERICEFQVQALMDQHCGTLSYWDTSHYFKLVIY